MNFLDNRCHVQPLHHCLAVGVAALLVSCHSTPLTSPTLIERPAFSQPSFVASISQDPGVVPEQYLQRYRHIPDAEAWRQDLYEHKAFAKIEKRVNEDLQAASQDEHKSNFVMRLYGALSAFPNPKNEYTPQDKQDYLHQTAVLQEWMAAYPDSHIPYLVQGKLHVKYAWKFRTGQVARKVTEEGWQLFHYYLQTAASDFSAASQLDPNDPNIWNELLHLAARTNLDPYTPEYFFEQGLNANPYHSGLHTTYLQTLYPQWGGSEKQMLAFARAAHKKGQATQKPMLGNVLLLVAREIDQKDAVHPITWSEIETVYQEIFAQYPDYLRMRYYYAHDALEREKFDVAIQQFEIIGDRWTTNTLWDDLNAFHRSRVFVYFKEAVQLYKQATQQHYQANTSKEHELVSEAEKRVLKALELWPQASGYLFLAGIHGNIYKDIPQAIDFANQALALNPSPAEREYAEDFIQQAEGLLARQRR
ncbi:DUF4034 domain-containing protein [Acaryochloris marina]|uniref:DUF4034 domain-containing protein n=1 Tax=Acaryochloris marina TaxID=155978 RepID=UPI0021C38913|nr:DUF4034 domain-containing protein [Acaryochloris marina]BDM77770.1 hypothetical protein AM10699_06420 [Acaryochloris marina MBIC10699]